jgi:hypothetical protein
MFRLADKLGMKDVELAELLGVHFTTISKWRVAKSVPTAERWESVQTAIKLLNSENVAGDGQLVRTLRQPKPKPEKPAPEPAAPAVDGSHKTPQEMARLFAMEYLSTCSSKEWEAILSAVLVARGLVTIQGQG